MVQYNIDLTNISLKIGIFRFWSLFFILLLNLYIVNDFIMMMS